MSDTLSKLLIVLPVVLISMSIHEMMHAYASHWLGDDTAYRQGRVSLNPLRHIDPFFTVALPLLAVLTFGTPFGAAKPVQVNFSRLKFGEFGGAIVGMIGPITNLVLAVIAAIIFRHLNITSDTLFKIFAYTVAVNIGFFVFNSIPWPPLDGSRLLYAFAPKALQEFMESIERMGTNGLIIFMLLVFTVLSAPISRIIVSLSNSLLGSNVF